MKVPLLDLQAQYARIKPEIDAAIQAVVTSQRFVLGPEVDALEEEVAEHLGVEHAVACASGSDALLLSLMALDIGPSDQVLCPSFTFFATAGAVARLGAEPVFADLEPVGYTLSPESAERIAGRCTRLRAILPVHLYGQAADLDALLGLADATGVPLIEDTAQAIGALDAGGVPVGTRGAVGCISCFPSKNWGAYGDAGVIVTRDPERAALLRMLRVHGGKKKYFHERVGVNSRLDALQAAVLRVKLRHLPTWSRERAERAATYDAAFAAAGAAASDVPLSEGGLSLRTPLPPRAPATHIYHQYVVRVPAGKRDALKQHLEDAGIGSAIYYPLGLHMQECFRGGLSGEGDLPETEAAARETLALPVYPELDPAQQQRVVDTIVGFLT